MSDRLKRIEQLQQENQKLRESLSILQEFHNKGQKELTRLRDELCKSRDCYNKVWEEKTRLREARDECERQFQEQVAKRGQEIDEILRLREALRLLYDYQNGPPLQSYEEQWNLAMNLARAALAPQEGKQE